jgi:hypothetical protein
MYNRPACSLKLVTRTPVNALPSDHVEVESILDHRPKSAGAQDLSEYLGKWKRLDITHCSWVASKDLNGPSLITAYFKSLTKGNNSPKKD